MADNQKKIDEIRELKAHYTENLYNKVRKEQKDDISYIDDTFPMPEVKAPHVPMRLGTGYDIVNAPAEQIVTSNPQVFVQAEDHEVEIRIGKLINQQWIPILKRMNPNPFKESVKNQLARGESYIQLAHNEDWVTGKLNKTGLPVLFLLLDPMVIYGSPEEDENGIPRQVIISYPRQAKDLIVRYPNWTNPKKTDEANKKNQQVEWFGYWDRENRYFEADGESVLEGGIHPNLYGFPPFIRKYSGFGKRSPDGELANLIVSDIRQNRDMIRNECAVGSDIVSIIHLFSHVPKNIILPMGVTISQDQIDELKFGAYALNVLNLPETAKYENEKPPMPTPEMFAFWADISSRIKQRNPFLTAGFPSGGSGRQQDITGMAAMRRYDTVLENTEHAWAVAFEKALGICKKIPGLYPEGLLKHDLDKPFKCVVKLKSEDALESDRRATLGDRLWAQGNGCIDLETNLVEYQGKTPEQAQRIMTKMLVDKVTIYNPDVNTVLGMMYAEEWGMDKALEEAYKRNAETQGQQKAMQQMPAPTTMQRIQGEAETPPGQELIDLSLGTKGSRQPPTRFTRGA